jgi:hypothetical protein
VTLAVSVLRGVLELEGELDDPADVGGPMPARTATPTWRCTAAGGSPMSAPAVRDRIDGRAGRRRTPRETGERLLRDLEARVEDRALPRPDAPRRRLDEPRRLR